MSLAAMAHVFNLNLPASEKWLAVCMADYADELGESIFPSLEALEAKAGMARSTVKRTIVKLLQLGVLERVAEATPVSPAFYRIVGVPEPADVDQRAVCPHSLRRAVVTTFQRRCEFCGQSSESSELGPDKRPWQIVRLGVGVRAALYAPHTVTLGCKACVIAKRAAASVGARTMTQVQRHEAAQIGLPQDADATAAQASVPPQTEGVQIEPSRPTTEGTQIEPSSTEEGVHPEAGGGSNWTGRGFTVSPDPLLIRQDPSEIRRTVAAPRPVANEPTADDCLNLLTKLAHEGFSACCRTDGDCVEHVKRRAAGMRIPYNSTVVAKAVTSARVQRHRRSA